MPELSDARFRWGLIFALLVVYICGLSLLWRHKPEIANENNLMENLQAVSLAIGMLVSSVAAMSKRWPERFILIAVAYVMLMLFLRELDVEKLTLPVLLIALGSGPGRNLLMGGVAFALLAVYVRNYRVLRPAVIALLKHECCLPLYLGVIFYLLGDIFDKRLFAVSRLNGYFFEELCENAATYFLALGAIWTIRVTLAKRKSLSREL